MEQTHRHLTRVLLVTIALVALGCGDKTAERPTLPGDTTDATGADATRDTQLTGPPRPDTGEATDTADDDVTADDTATQDTSTTSQDTSMPPQDTTVPDPCAGVDCGPGGSCSGGVCSCTAPYVLENNTCVLDDPCADVVCDSASRCEDGACVCNPGFVLVNGTCIAEDPGNPATRSEAEVCARWLADYPTTTSTIYQAGAGACDPGTIDPTAHDDAMRRLNLYRWLVGLDPAGVDATHQAKAQAAALMMDANDSLSHSPPTDWDCYSSDGAQAAGASNLALGYANPAATVDGYMRDSNTPSLGHRRWCLNPDLDDVGFGHYGRGGAMWCFGQSSKTEPEFVAYPAPGPFPIDALLGDWSFGMRTASISGATVTVTRLSDNAVLDAPTSQLAGGYGNTPTLGIDVSSGDIAAGETYRIEVVTSNDAWVYETTLVDCSP